MRSAEISRFDEANRACAVPRHLTSQQITPFIAHSPGPSAADQGTSMVLHDPHSQDGGQVIFEQRQFSTSTNALGAIFSDPLYYIFTYVGTHILHMQF